MVLLTDKLFDIGIGTRNAIYSYYSRKTKATESECCQLFIIYPFAQLSMGITEPLIYGNNPEEK